MTHAPTRRALCQPPDQAWTMANTPSTAAAGAAGYSVTTDQPAARPTSALSPASRRLLPASRSATAAAKAVAKQPAVSACPHRMVAYTHAGPASPNASPANVAPLADAPSLFADQARHIAATTVGTPAAQTVAAYDRIAMLRLRVGSTPTM